MSQAIESDATASSPAERVKILVADDEANIRRVLETRLAMQGHDVKVAENGNEALELFRGFEPDVVVLDVMMPELDGFAVVERIRAQSEVPIIMLTALGDVADRITGLQLGADDYMVKPFSPKELEARIRCVLRRASTSLGGVGGAVGRNTHVVMVGDLSVDFNRRQAHRGDERIRLTAWSSTCWSCSSAAAANRSAGSTCWRRSGATSRNAPPTAVWWMCTSHGCGPSSKKTRTIRN